MFTQEEPKEFWKFSYQFFGFGKNFMQQASGIDVFYGEFIE
jgi:hypothetical protein